MRINLVLHDRHARIEIRNLLSVGKYYVIVSTLFFIFSGTVWRMKYTKYELSTMNSINYYHLLTLVWVIVMSKHTTLAIVELFTIQVKGFIYLYNFQSY